MTPNRLSFGIGMTIGILELLGGCSGPSGEAGVEALELAVQVSPGVHAVAVDYRVSGNGIVPVEGTIDLGSPRATVSALVHGLPPGTGYRVELNARISDGTIVCTGQAAFLIEAGRRTHVSVTLQCPTVQNGGEVSVTGRFNACPAIISYAVSPIATVVGDPIHLSAAAADSDAGDTLQFAWTASTGGFSSAGEAQTVFQCPTAGTHHLTLTVSDGSCSVDTSFDVSCDEVDAGAADAPVDAGGPDAADGPGTEVGSACGAAQLNELDGAVFTVWGSQTVSKMTQQQTAPLTCFAGVVSEPVSTRAHLSLYQGLWYLWYEGPYTTVTIPQGLEAPAVAAQAVSPPTPFAHPFDPQRRGIPLLVGEPTAAGEFLFQMAPEATQAVAGVIPLCPDYRYDTGNVFAAELSFQWMTVSLNTGKVQLGHSCATHHIASGCGQPSLSDVMFAGGHLCEATPGACPGCSGSCVNARCLETVATDQTGVSRMDKDAGNLFWSTAGTTPAIMTAVRSGGAPSKLLDTPLPIADLVVYYPNIYWTAYQAGSGSGLVAQRGLSGGPIVTLAEGTMMPQAITADGTHVYWTRYDTGEILKTPIDGGTSISLLAGWPVSAPIDVNRSGVVFTDAPGGRVMRLALNGIGLSKLDDAFLNWHAGVVADASSAFWVGMGGVTRTTANPQLNQVLSSQAKDARAIAFDGESVFWYSEGGLRKVPARGGETRLLLPDSSMNPVGAIVVDNNSVFWTEPATGRVMKLSPK
jgi:hypothetical protein